MIEPKIIIDYAFAFFLSGFAVAVWGFVVVGAYILYKRKFLL
jgi:hypothetical protein